MRDYQTRRPIGRVVGLWRYPVKSMGGEPLAAVDVSWHGVAGDRRWAFIRDGVTQSGFPWLTLRQRANMSHYSPSFADPTRPDQSPVNVRTPSGATFDVMDAALAAELDPKGTRVIKQNRGVFDTFPLSLVTTQTLVNLSGLVGSPLSAQRFRPNILVESTDPAPFAEDSWVGYVLHVGGMSMRVDQRDRRCAVITIDPLTSEHSPAILRTVADEREGCVGVYGSTVQPGRIAVGDQVFIESAAPPL